MAEFDELWEELAATDHPLTLKPLQPALQDCTTEEMAKVASGPCPFYPWIALSGVLYYAECKGMGRGGYRQWRGLS